MSLKFRWAAVLSAGIVCLVLVQLAFGIPDPPPDTDNDGLPDPWEMAHFGNLNQNGSGDFDGDGLTNLQEYQMGTNPRNPFSNGQLHVFTPLK